MKPARTVLICGSREITQGLRELAIVIVKKQWWVGNHVIVGDALGIDREVVKTAEVCQMHYRCYGVLPSARNGAVVYECLPLLTTLFHLREAYRRRDEFMVRQADLVICLWNGLSHGTKHVADYAIAEGKEVYLRTSLRVIYDSRRVGV